ncbi:arsenate reductase ArsC [Seleniivibrio sp.]|uniref:arsenate reductase ArsC n=1 Tax=Seleniivibrio sp. TaxID=2898801 RepID=UPI0025CF5DDC|nr:arsenate reductase ArsC [Seleniivibrio sp.]MCD8553781.1 arsenate reductase ArsC [Seleniivibrio sp.]
MKRVLFVCVHNSARSQMAESFLNGLSGFSAHSAGLEPGSLNPFVVRAMAEVGVDISCNRTKSVTEFLGQDFDYVIAVCDKEAADRCPVVPVSGEKMHWEFPDPSSFQGTDEQKLAFARTVRDAIQKKILDWAAL